jgi:predicted RNase H-like nuclease
MWVAGVDGCRNGWVVVLRDRSDSMPPRCRICRDFAEVLDLEEQPGILAIDIPIGLPERGAAGGRTCDAAARAVLGMRQSAVFAVPARAAVMTADYREACKIALGLSDPPRKVSKQCFNLFPKMREVDRHMTPALQARVFEAHPEAAFWIMNGKAPLPLPKKIKSRPHPSGLDFRRTLLRGAAQWPDGFLDRPPAGVGLDDLIDAAALAITADRIAAGKAMRFPDEPPLDARGLRMEIWC